MQQVIHLQPDDDLPAIQDLLEAAQARRVLLVLPRSYAALRQPLSLRILRRHAANLALDVALVTRDSHIRALARAEGLATVPSITVGRWDRWRNRAPSRSAAQRAAAVRVAGLRSGRGDPGYGDRAIRWAGRFLAVFVFVLLVAVLVGLAALTIPQAKITLVPLRQSVEVSLSLRADPQVEKADIEKLVIPARLVEVEIEESGQTPTQATQDAPDAPAVGRLTIINEAAAAREIRPGAIVRTSTGTTVRFRTVTTATLDARVGARAEVEIEALEPGPVGNVSAATINTVETADLRGKVRVINELPTSGGSVKQVGVVTRADMDRLKAQLLQQLQQHAYTQLQERLGEQEFMPAESMTVEILSEVYDQFLDATADVLTLTMRIYATATAVDQASARLLTFKALETRLPAKHGLTADDMRFTLAPGVAMEGRSVLFGVNASAEWVADVAPREARAVARGLTVAEAVQALMGAFALETPPAVEIEPEWVRRWSWLDRVPFLPFRIQVVVLK